MVNWYGDGSEWLIMVWLMINEVIDGGFVGGKAMVDQLW